MVVVETVVILVIKSLQGRKDNVLSLPKADFLVFNGVVMEVAEECSSLWV